MNQEQLLSHFNLLSHGDRHEREYWLLLSERFPSYEIFWQKFVVPRTQRVNQKISISQEEWVRLRNDVSSREEKIAMAHYSVFYFIGRAVSHLSKDEEGTIHYPEDVFFLLNSAIENLKTFLKEMNGVGKDLDQPIFKKNFSRFPKGFPPFEEIEAYRNALSHNAVMGRAVGVQKTFLPRWNSDKAKSALKRVEGSWLEAERLDPEDLIDSRILLDRLLTELFVALEGWWKKVLLVLATDITTGKLERPIDLRDWDLDALESLGSTEAPSAASGTFFWSKDE